VGFSRRIRVERFLSLGLVLTVLSTIALAGEEDSAKPEDWEQRLEDLRSVPYVGLSEEPVEEHEAGLVLYDPDKSCDGYFLYNTRSSGEVLLLDVKGQVAHRWTYPPAREEGSPLAVHFGDHALLLENGDVIILSKFLELLRIDWNSNLLWKKELHPHHDVAAASDGTLYVIVRESEMYRGLKVKFPSIVHLTAGGLELDRWSSYARLSQMREAFDTRCFLDTYLDSALASRKLEGKIAARIRSARLSPEYYYDYFHMNAVSVLPANRAEEKDAIFRRGNLLTCFRNVNQIAVLERDTYQILWVWGEGELQWPHHPTMLQSGHILIFDNGVERKYSRVMVLDPVQETIVWQYVGDPPETFFSRDRGSAQRLPNGNTLICESNKGRVFQVTPEGEVVWNWLNPKLQYIGRGKPHRETVYRMLYYSPEVVDPLLGRW